MRSLRLLFAAALAMVPPLIALNAAPAAPALQETATPPIPGVYTTNWGRGVLTISADGRTGEFRFGNGTRIVGNFVPRGSPQFIGDYVAFTLPARGYYEPPRCDATVPPRAFLSGPSSTRWWGTIYIHFTPDERVRGYVIPCRSLPHNRAEHSLQLTGVLVERTPTRVIDSQAARTAVRVVSPDRLRPLLDGYLQATCGARPGAPGIFTDCTIRDRSYFFFRVRSALPAGQGYLAFAPLSSNVPAVITALRNGTEPPRRGGAPSFRQDLRTTQALVPGNTLTIDFDPRLCGANLWLVTLVDGRGTVHPHSGLQVSPCGPREGSFAAPESDLKK